MNDYPLARELKNLLVNEGVAVPINLRVDDGPAGYLRMRIMAASTGKLGPVLAALSRPDELEDPESLSSRLTSADQIAGHWRYNLTVTRYPVDRSMVFLLTVLLPAGDLPEVVSRLRAQGKPLDPG